jgi:hypothetical protein
MAYISCRRALSLIALYAWLGSQPRLGDFDGRYKTQLVNQRRDSPRRVGLHKPYPADYRIGQLSQAFDRDSHRFAGFEPAFRIASQAYAKGCSSRDTMSPGSNGVIEEMYSISSGILKINSLRVGVLQHFAIDRQLHVQCVRIGDFVRCHDRWSPSGRMWAGSSRATTAMLRTGYRARSHR